MADFVLTAHAEVALAARGIRTEWVNRVLEFPERVDEDKSDAQHKHALARIPEHGDRVLRVVFNDAVRGDMSFPRFFVFQPIGIMPPIFVHAER